MTTYEEMELRAMIEKGRKLARYDEAVALLREAKDGADLISFSLADRIRAFLAAEPKTEER